MADSVPLQPETKIVQLLWQDYDICDHRGAVSIARDANMLALYQEYCQTPHKPATWLSDDYISFMAWLVSEKGATIIEIEEFDLNSNGLP